MTHTQPDASPDPARQGSGNGRLDSWKEISAYLGRGVTTVQRWEQDEGLPVHRLPHARKGSVFAFKGELDEWRASRVQAPAASRPDTRAARAGRRGLWMLTAGVAAGALIAVGLIAPGGFAARPPNAAGAAILPFVPRPVANDGASELWPSLSPDGDRVVYVWQREGSSGLYIKPVSAGPAVPLRFDDQARFATASFPKWSPRGDLIAFLANEEGADPDTRGLYVVSPAGGSPRRIMSIYGTGLCWTPDGDSLAFTDRTSTGEPFSIFLTSLETGRRQRLTTPPAGTFGDTKCGFSPDGRKLAVSRFASRYQSDLHVIAFPGGQDDDGERLTQGLSGINGVDWTPDSTGIVFGAHNGLWLVAASAKPGGKPALIAAAGVAVTQPTFSRTQGRPARLAYQHGIRDVNIWRWEAAPDGRGTMTRVEGSTVWEDHPSLSPDGRRIAFASNRTGANEIWVAARDGSNPVQLTFHDGPIVIAPRWSPDGSRIAFSSQVGANRDIYVVDADGTAARRLTWEASQEDNPSWSRDGRWMYFRSDRGGIAQIWKMPADGGTAVRVTSGTASQALESADGTRLYFVRSTDVPGLWSIPVGGGTETLVLPNVRESFWGVSDRGVAFLVSDPKLSPGAPTIRFFNFASRDVSTLSTLPIKPLMLSPGFSVARDGRTVLWTQTDVSQSDVMVIDSWHPYSVGEGPR
jgi:Tol biopolymer transport system component